MNAHDCNNLKQHKAWNPKLNGAGSASYYQRAPATKQSVFRANQGVEHFFKAKQPSAAKSSAIKSGIKGQNFETAEKFDKFLPPIEESTKSNSDNNSPQQHKYQSMVVVKSPEKLISLESSPNQEEDL